MALVNKPDESIFASSAKQGEVDNFPDLLRGWGISFEQTGGIPPMEWFNFLFKRLDEKHTYLMQRGLPEWSATQDYTKGSCVQFDGVSYRALKNSKNNRPNEPNSQYWVRWGFALSEIAQATLIQYGITKLYTGYDSQREDLALTPKTAYQLKQLIDSNTRALGNVIPNSKKSSAVNSNSADTVATSAAVKTAYDKGVEAKTAADNANQNAEGRVPKTGDTTINGTLRAKNTSGGWSAYQFETSQGFWQLEVHPNSHEEANRRFNMMFIPNIGNRVYLSFPTLGNDGEVVAYRSWAVNKAGDSMTGILYSVGISSKHYGYGNYANQYTSGAPFLVNAEGSQDRDTYHPFVKGLVRSKGRYGAGFSFGYTTKQGAGDGFGRGIINLIEDNGTSKNWSFEHSGDFVSPGDVKTSLGKSLNNAIYKDEGTHDIALSWVSDGLKVRLDKTDLGRVAFKHDIANEQLVWQGETRDALTVTLPVDRGILFVCVTKSWGAGTVNDMWLSAPIANCHNTSIGDQDAGGSAGDYNFSMALKITKNGKSVTLTPENARKPIIKKVVVVGA